MQLEYKAMYLGRMMGEVQSALAAPKRSTYSILEESGKLPGGYIKLRLIK